MFSRTLTIFLVLTGGVTLASGQTVLDVSMLGTGNLDAQLSERRAELEAERAEKLAIEQELVALPELERALESTLARDVRALYRLRRGGLLPMAEGLESLLGHASRVAHYERMTRRTLARLTQSQGSSARLAGEASVLEAKIEAIQQAVQELEHAQAAQAREAAASRAFEASRAEPAQAALNELSASMGTGYGLSVVGEAERGPKRARFDTQRGQLALPVSGAARIETADTLQGEPKALTFSNKPGSTVRAAADGRVVLAEPREGHGILVIVEHGDKYRSLYGGLDSSDVQAGDAISKSARIGTAGSQPIYFEVRHGMRSQDARSWLGL